MGLGDFDAGATLYHKFTTFNPSTGAPFTLAGTPAVSVYKDSSATQSTSGVTLTADFDSVTGLNHVAVDLSSDGTFYAAGSSFDIVITTGTVNSVSAVGVVVERFTIRKTSALKPATAGRALVVDASGLGDANTVKLGPSGSGTAQTAKDVGAINVTTMNTLSAHDPGGTIASQTNITAGTITTVTNLTNAATAGDLTATMKASVTAAVPAAALNASTLLAAALTVHDTTAITTSTVNDALLGARSQGGGAWGIVGTTLTLQNPDGSTFRTFTLDSSTAPTSRT